MPEHHGRDPELLDPGELAGGPCNLDEAPIS